MFNWIKRQANDVKNEFKQLVPGTARRNVEEIVVDKVGLRERNIRRKRQYNSAKSSRFMSGWSTSPSPINYQITSVLHTLLARSREAYQNNDYIKRAVSLRKSKVIGHTGIRWVPRVKTGGKLDKDINTQLNTLMKEMSKVGVLDVRGRLSLVDIQNRVEHQLFVDGEYIAIHRYSKDFKFGYALDEVDPMLLPVDLNKDLANGNIIRCGIELNKYKRPVFYHFLKENKSHHMNQYHGHDRDQTLRVPARFVTHVFHQEFTDQLRGVPKIATSLFRIEMLRKYIEAELIGATIGSRSGGFFVKQKDVIEPYTGEGDIDLNDPDEEDIEEDIEDEELEEMEPGSVKIAPVGYDFKAWDLNRPNNAFAEFLKENTRAVASSTDVNYSALSSNYEGVSFSSLRDSKLTDQEIEKQQQVFVTQHFLERFVPRAILAALDFGRWVINDKIIRSKTEYLAGEFFPMVAKNVDPVKTAQAHRILNRDLKVMSRERIARQWDVINPEEEFEAIKLEDELYPVYIEPVTQESTKVATDKEDETDAQKND